MVHRSEEGIYTSPWGDLPPVTPGSTYDHMYGRLRSYANEPEPDTRVALLNYATGESWTNRQVQEEATLIAATLLKKLGCTPDDKILISFPTSPIFALLSIACLRAGIVAAFANPAYTSHELQHTCNLVGAKLILTATPLKDNFLKAGITNDKIIDAVFPIPKGAKENESLWLSKIQSLKEAEDILERAGANKIDWNRAAAIFFSSGTTGLPKAVMVTHKNLICEAQSVFHIPGVVAPPDWHDGKPDTSILYLPAFHVAGFLNIIMASLHGSKIVFALSNPIDLPMIVRAIRDHRPYRLVMVPPLLMAVTRLGLAGKQGFHNTTGHIFSAAAPLGPEQSAEASKVLQVPIGQFWGLSETTGAATGSSPLDLMKHGSGGRVMPGAEVKIIDEEGNIMKHGERGELLVRGVMVMDCYYNNEKETSATLDKDGWLHSGDIGYFDDDGFLFVVDRRKELIKCKGFQVAPAELEALLLSHDAVMDAAVLGVPNEAAGEAPRAFIVLRSEHAKGTQIASISEGKALQPSDCQKARDIAKYVADRVASYKQLRGGVVFLNEIPKNPSGKILRRVLKDLSSSDKSKL